MLFAAAYFLLAPYADTLFAAYSLLNKKPAKDVLVSPLLNDNRWETPGEFARDETQTDAVFEDETRQIREIPLSDVIMPRVGAAYGRLAISSVGIDLPLFFGDDAAQLKKGAGQYTGSRLCGFGTPVLVSAHNTKDFFLSLQDIQIGDVCGVSVDYGDFSYEVYKTEIINKNAFDLDILNENEEILILYTCYPFGAIGLTPDRFFVYAAKTAGPVVVR